ncbi:MAG: hypothetical protein ETSY2_41960 [Candidatus Entotheonella gemina]|uniref:Uncharacterized protein n=1 Tax=Candidatus Entotheonella gemina TaxID=1429439 RepID=W4LNG5_9BACT|nr:MAG: hypothetical protein ETSY2_41960 [Candidatus Entotheonella gemina]
MHIHICEGASVDLLISRIVAIEIVLIRRMVSLHQKDFINMFTHQKSQMLCSSRVASAVAPELKLECYS